MVGCFLLLLNSPVATNKSDILIIHPNQRKKIKQLQFVVNKLLIMSSKQKYLLLHL